MAISTIAADNAAIRRFRSQPDREVGAPPLTDVSKRDEPRPSGT